MSMYYDMDGTPIKDVLVWAEKFEHSDRHIAQKRMWFGLVRVSTVWLGMDHNFSWMAQHPNLPNPNPLQFETMVFIAGHGGYMRRWMCKEQAEAGHSVVVREMRNPVILFKRWREYKW